MQFWKVVVFMSTYAAFLDASENAGKKSKWSSKGKSGPEGRNVTPCLDAKLNQGERIVEKLTSEIGPEKTAALLQSLAQKANGSQPSGEKGVVDLDHIVNKIHVKIRKNTRTRNRSKHKSNWLAD